MYEEGECLILDPILVSHFSETSTTREIPSSAPTAVELTAGERSPDLREPAVLVDSRPIRSLPPVNSPALTHLREKFAIKRKDQSVDGSNGSLKKRVIDNYFYRSSILAYANRTAFLPGRIPPL